MGSGRSRRGLGRGGNAGGRVVGATNSLSPTLVSEPPSGGLGRAVDGLLMGI